LEIFGLAILGFRCASPQEQTVEKIGVREAADSGITCAVFVATSIGRFAGFGNFWFGDPGVSLRFTPGSMLPAASRISHISTKAILGGA
jgi:hypothetical protein